MGPNKTEAGTRDKESLCPRLAFAIVACMGFHELIEQGRDPGDNGLPTEYFDTLSAEFEQTTKSYEQRMQELSEGFSVKDAERQAQLDAMNSEIARLKSANYDLLMSSAAGDIEGSGQQGPEDGPSGVTSLFD